MFGANSVNADSCKTFTLVESEDASRAVLIIEISSIEISFFEISSPGIVPVRRSYPLTSMNGESTD
jgi:hypothetical protein